MSPSARAARSRFDEALVGEKLASCRGSGVLVRGDAGAWRIAQYSLTADGPNEAALTSPHCDA